MLYPVFISEKSRHPSAHLTVIFLCLALLALITPSFSAQASDYKTEDLTTVYKVIAADGSISFSDQPNVQSETLLVPPIPTVPAIPIVNTKPTPAKITSNEAISRYQSLSILAPANDSAFYSGSGEVDVILDIKPALYDGDQVQLILDGQLMKSDDQIQSRLKTVSRGTHELRVKLVSSSGKLHKESTSTFTVHRPSVRN